MLEKAYKLSSNSTNFQLMIGPKKFHQIKDSLS